LAQKGDERMEAYGPMVMVCLAVWVYFSPSVIAAWRQHPQVQAIFALNLLTGWTMVGWVACVVWCYTVKARVRR
jgi:Superinfection immunity protein